MNTYYPKRKEMTQEEKVAFLNKWSAECKAILEKNRALYLSGKLPWQKGRIPSSGGMNHFSEVRPKTPTTYP